MLCGSCGVDEPLARIGQNCARCGKVFPAPGVADRPALQPATATSPPRPDAYCAQRILAIVVAALGCLGTFLPWGGIGPIMVVNGTAGDGWISLACFALIIGATLFTGKRNEPTSTAAFFLGLGALAVGVHDISALTAVELATVGPGLYLVAIAGGLLMLLGAFAASPWLGAFTILAMIGMIALGFVHVVYNPSLRACAKSSWSLKETFLDLDEFRAGTKIDLGNQKVIGDLERCSLVTIEHAPERPPPTQTLGRCYANGERGDCMSASSCSGTSYAGLCPGSDDIQCCVR